MSKNYLFSSAIQLYLNFEQDASAVVYKTKVNFFVLDITMQNVFKCRILDLFTLSLVTRLGSFCNSIVCQIQYIGLSLLVLRHLQILDYSCYVHLLWLLLLKASLFVLISSPPALQNPGYNPLQCLASLSIWINLHTVPFYSGYCFPVPIYV